MLSGCLHALTGPDHLAALLPLCMGRRFWVGGSYGALWGLGHAVSSVAVGYFAFRMRDLFLETTSITSRYSYVGDFVVALTVMVIGLMGLYETREGAESSDVHSTGGLKVAMSSSDKEDSGDEEVGVTESSRRAKESNGTKSTLSLLPIATISTATSVCTPSSPWRRRVRQRCCSTACLSHLLHQVVVLGTVVINGVALGLSFDGFPSLAPAIVLDNALVIAFLMSYFLSTVITMAVTSGVIGETSYWITRHIEESSSESADAEEERQGEVISAGVNSNQSPSKLSDHLARYTSFIACFIGWIWFIIAYMKYMFQSDVEDGSLMDDIAATVLKFTSSGAGGRISAFTNSAASSADTLTMAGAPNNDNIIVDHEIRTSTILNILSIGLVAIALVVSISQEFHVSWFNSSSNSGIKGWFAVICSPFYCPSMLSLVRRKQKSEDEVL